DPYHVGVGWHVLGDVALNPAIALVRNRIEGEAEQDDVPHLEADAEDAARPTRSTGLRVHHRDGGRRQTLALDHLGDAEPAHIPFQKDGTRHHHEQIAGASAPTTAVRHVYAPASLALAHPSCPRSYGAVLQQRKPSDGNAVVSLNTKK